MSPARKKTRSEFADEVAEKLLAKIDARAAAGHQQPCANQCAPVVHSCKFSDEAFELITEFAKEYKETKKVRTYIKYALISMIVGSGSIWLIKMFWNGLVHSISIKE